jgi:hypothetical protein
LIGGGALFAAVSLDLRRPFHPTIRRKIMKKLRLDMDALVVESFRTSELENGLGTVHGAQDGNVSAGGATQCGGVQTCGEGCRITAGGPTHCGGIQTCGEGCRPTAGGDTKCGGIQTCGDGCQK